jgi:hypothetical protein
MSSKSDESFAVVAVSRIRSDASKESIITLYEPDVELGVNVGCGGSDSILCFARKALMSWKVKAQFMRNFRYSFFVLLTR